MKANIELCWVRLWALSVAALMLGGCTGEVISVGKNVTIEEAMPLSNGTVLLLDRSTARKMTCPKTNKDDTLDQGFFYDPRNGNLTSRHNIHVRRKSNGALFVENLTVDCDRCSLFQSVCCEPAKTEYALMTRLRSGALLCIGGNASHGDFPLVPISSALLKEPKSEGWTTIPSPPVPHLFGRAVELNDERVLVCGGLDSKRMETGACHLVDLRSKTWSDAGNMSIPRTNFTLLRLSEGRAIAIGGLSSDRSELSSTEIYNPATNDWRAGPRLSIARFDPSVAILDAKRLLIVGGERKSDGESIPVYEMELLHGGAL